MANDDKVYMTEGARKNLHRMWIAYLILAISGVVGTWALTHRSDQHLRHEINELGVANCIASRTTLHKYNDLVDSILTTRRQFLGIAIKEHNKSQIILNRQALKRYSQDKLPIPTVKQCKNPIIKP